MQFMHNLFVYDEELSGTYRATHFVATVAIQVSTYARIYHVRSLVGTLVDQYHSNCARSFMFGQSWHVIKL